MSNLAINEIEWKHTSWLLEELEDPFVMFPVQSVANSLSKALTESQESFDCRMGPDGVARKYWDVPTELIYDEIGLLIGSAFVLGQVTLSQTLAIVGKLSDRAKNANVIPKGKEAILAFEAIINSKSGLSEMIIIDSVANYFKHHHEWPSNWDEPAKGSVRAKTIHNIKQIGMRPGNVTDNLYQALNTLNVDDLKIMQMADKIHAWRERLARRLYIAVDFPDPFEGL